MLLFSQYKSQYIAGFNRNCLVRIAKRLVRFNSIEKTEDSHRKAKRVQYACEKCGMVFGAWKHLRQHKVEKHAY